RLAELAQLVFDPPRPVAIVPIGDEAGRKARGIAERLRDAGFTVELGFGGNLKKRMKQANKIAATAALLIGEDELARNAATLRDLDSGEQSEVALDQLEAALAPYR
ncbi:MAG: His/Gly/Thr/Pro-type tRNA ligase C-terminal domain-containing protein, partial [Alphaproteobacteria bacterium]|nr:His/Gly/Thr/Pro-type tRNA ligase C-terminal domain-containing protein [Alphaproteobacteria bacterium]